MRRVILFFFLFLLNFSFSQNSIYDEYYSLEDFYEEKDNLDSLETVFNNHLSKAVELNDTIEQLKVLRWKYWYSSFEIDQGKILNQLNTISKVLNNKREVAANYYVIASKEYYKAIQQWTAEKGFLNNNISLSSLATELNTNTAYLSQVFNKNIGVSFSEYISSCRVEYIISEVKKP